MATLTNQKIAATTNLRKLGLSYLGVNQVLSAQIVTSQQDRELLANIIGIVNSAKGEAVRRYYLENSWPSK